MEREEVERPEERRRRLGVVCRRGEKETSVQRAGRRRATRSKSKPKGREGRKRTSLSVERARPLERLPQALDDLTDDVALVGRGRAGLGRLEVGKERGDAALERAGGVGLDEGGEVGAFVFGQRGRGGGVSRSAGASERGTEDRRAKEGEEGGDGPSAMASASRAGVPARG